MQDTDSNTNGVQLVLSCVTSVRSDIGPLPGRGTNQAMSRDIATLFYSEQDLLRRMASSVLLRRVALVGTEVSEELSFSETSVLTRATLRNIPEDPISS
jgi:hypothetical protein